MRPMPGYSGVDRCKECKLCTATGRTAAPPPSRTGRNAACVPRCPIAGHDGQHLLLLRFPFRPLCDCRPLLCCAILPNVVGSSAGSTAASGPNSCSSLACVTRRGQRRWV